MKNLYAHMIIPIFKRDIYYIHHNHPQLSLIDEVGGVVILVFIDAPLIVPYLLKLELKKHNYNHQPLWLWLFVNCPCVNKSHPSRHYISILSQLLKVEGGF